MWSTIRNKNVTNGNEHINPNDSLSLAISLDHQSLMICCEKGHDHLDDHTDDQDPMLGSDIMGRLCRETKGPDSWSSNQQA